jgi:hypothetical protein
MPATKNFHKRIKSRAKKRHGGVSRTEGLEESVVTESESSVIFASTANSGPTTDKNSPSDSKRTSLNGPRVRPASKRKRLRVGARKARRNNR